MRLTRSVFSKGSAFRAALVAAVVVVGVGAWQGAAGASSSHKDMSAFGRSDIEAGNANCGDSTGGNIIGSVKIQRRTQGLQIDWNLKKGLKQTVYSVSLWDYETCTKIADLGTVKSNSEGRARRRYMYKPTVSSTAVFTDGFDGSSANDSIHVAI